MSENVVTVQPRRKFGGVFFSALLAGLMILTMFQTIRAQEGARDKVIPPDLNASQKQVSNSQANPGSVLQYTIVLSNSGSEPAAVVTMTDTLPAELTYEANSLMVTGGGLYGEANGVITWTGSVNNGTAVVVSFNAMLDGSLKGGETVTNTAVISYSEGVIDRSAVTTIITDSYSFFPAIYLPFPIPSIVLNPVPRPSPSNSWNVSWSVDDDTYITNYELQEATNPNFTNANTIDVPVGTQNSNRTLPLQINNLFYYRVRAIGSFGASAWSNVQQVLGGYRDDFNDPNSGWDMRRQDTDTVVNDSFYRDGHLVLEMDSSYDYQIVSSLAPTPGPAYQIESRIRLVGVDNLHSYGIIRGADWNGQTCPNPDYSSCFNVYYRLNVIWSGNLGDRLTIQVKRIDYHDPADNTGRGVDLIQTSVVDVIPPAAGYQTWAIQVYGNGVMRLFLNGNMIREFFDTSYITNPYFGAFSSTDEYNGLEAEFDYFQVTYLP